MRNAIPTPASGLDFERDLPLLRERAKEIERSVLAGICHQLEEQKGAHGEFGVAEFWMDRNDCPRFNIRLPLDFDRNAATYHLDDFATEVRILMQEFANVFYNALCDPTTSLAGPDAASFAMQMRRPDVAAIIETGLIEQATKVALPHIGRSGL